VSEPIGKRKTRAREVIPAVVRRAQGPLTVAQILEQAQKDLPGLGVATVYRTVKLLLEAGEIVAVVLPDGLARYESARKSHHHHFQCRACEEVFCIDSCPVTGLERRKALAGFEVQDHDLTVFGSCPDCAEMS
jgi:Fur family ferric uptake transcriptional regulator